MSGPERETFEALRAGLFGPRREAPQEPAPAPGPPANGGMDPREAVAARHGVPVEAIRGDTAADLEAHAVQVRELLDSRPAQGPVVDAQGKRPSKYTPRVNPLRNLTNPGAPVPHDVAHPDHDTAHQNPGWIGH